MKEIDNPYLKELTDELPGTVLQAKVDSTVKCYSLTLPVRRYLVPTPSTRGG